MKDSTMIRINKVMGLLYGCLLQPYCKLVKIITMYAWGKKVLNKIEYHDYFDGKGLCKIGNYKFSTHKGIAKLSDLYMIYSNVVKNQYQLDGNYDVIVDIGAHIGSFTIPASNHAQKVIAIEPCLSSLILLNKNIIINKRENIIIVGKAITNKTGTTKLYHNINPAQNSIYGHGKHELVHTISLKELMKDLNIGKIDLLKIDCESAENLILDDLYDLDVKNIVMELHDPHSQLHPVLLEKYNTSIDHNEKYQSVVIAEKIID